jgi:hypothetical protein
MNTRTRILEIVAIVAVAVVGLAPATAHAQKNRGQLVQAVVKLNNAQLQFAKRLAEDAQFAAQFDQATQSGNYDAAASLAAAATGLSKSNISVGPGSLSGDDDNDAASASATQTSVYQLASFTRRNERKMTSGKICFNWMGVVQGCIEW